MKTEFEESRLVPRAQQSQVILYTAAAISRHLKNIYASNELNQEATISKMETVQIEGHRDIIS